MRFLLAFWGVCAYAQSGIDVPIVGALVDSSGAMRPVQGVAGNFLLGPATVSGVLSAACSEQLCLAKADSKILSGTGATEAPPGPAVFAVHGEEAVVFFPESQTFARWHDNTLDLLDWSIAGEVLSIRGTEIAVRQDGRVWDVLPDGSVIDWIADTIGPVLLFEDAVVFGTPDQLVLRHPDGSELRFELTGAETIAAMGPHYVAIRAGDALFTLRTEPGRESLFLLPAFVPTGSSP